MGGVGRAPARVTFAAARDAELFQQPLVRAIIRARELVLGASADTAVRPRGLPAETQALGWGALAEIPGRHLVVGAVTRPWQANVTFRAIPPEQFAAFAEPDYVGEFFPNRLGICPGEERRLISLRPMTCVPAAREAD